MSRYRRKAYPVQARKVTKPEFVRTPDGEVYAKPGVWVVTEDSGDMNVCTDEMFRLKFEPDLPPEGK